MMATLFPLPPGSYITVCRCRVNRKTRGRRDGHSKIAKTFMRPATDSQIAVRSWGVDGAICRRRLAVACNGRVHWRHHIIVFISIFRRGIRCISCAWTCFHGVSLKFDVVFVCFLRCCDRRLAGFRRMLSWRPTARPMSARLRCSPMLVCSRHFINLCVSHGVDECNHQGRGRESEQREDERGACCCCCCYASGRIWRAYLDVHLWEMSFIDWRLLLLWR